MLILWPSPQVDEKQLNHILRLVDDGKRDGTLVHGGSRYGNKVRPIVSFTQTTAADIHTKGNFMEPTILMNVPRSSDAYKEEIFGPVVIVNTFKDEDEALLEANATDFGLFCKLLIPLMFMPDYSSLASVYTLNFERAVRFAKRLEAGAVGVNCSVPVRALDMPVGGWKQSGTGRELALHGLNLYTELKTIFLKFGQDSSSLANQWHCGEP